MGRHTLRLSSERWAALYPESLDHFARDVHFLKLIVRLEHVTDVAEHARLLVEAWEVESSQYEAGFDEARFDQDIREALEQIHNPEEVFMPYMQRFGYLWPDQTNETQ